MSRTIAIGDIHGCLVALESLLTAIAPAPDDVLVTLGDYINRGPDSRGVIDRLIALSSECRLVSLLGNHELSLLEARSRNAAFERFRLIGGDVCLASYGAAHSVTVIPEGHWHFLVGCRPFHETDSHIFLHASYWPDRSPADMHVETLFWTDLRDPPPPPHVSGKRVIVGHTPQMSGSIRDHGHVVAIDTGAGFGGRLTALDVDTGRIWQALEDGSLV